MAIAVVVVIVLNAVFAFVQELQAERAVEALRRYLPQQATVLRDGRAERIDAVAARPRRRPADRRGRPDLGRRAPARGRARGRPLDPDRRVGAGDRARPTPVDTGAPLLQARDLVFSGTDCTGGEARALVFATGMGTELGRIAALSERVEREESPLERQVRRVAWLIAGDRRR